MKATLITIGDEILIGQTIDTNSAWMGKELNQIGIIVHEIISISDTPEHVIQAIETSMKSSDIILTTGGLGPTKDDLTKETLAEYFGKNLVVHEGILSMIEAYFESRGRTLTEHGKKVSLVPDDTKLFINTKGTAPATWHEKGGKMIISMPGVPYEMKNFMNNDIIPELKKLMPETRIYHKTLMTAGVGETMLAAQIEDIESNLPPHIKLAYLPNLAVVRLRLSAMGTDENTLKKDVDKFADKIEERLGKKWVFAYDDELLEEAIGKMLMARKSTMGIAESCTGGQIAANLVSVPGSSAYFEGSVVAYSYSIKSSLLGVQKDTLEQHGAVSQEAVEQMATGALKLLNVDFAIATSGIAGPSGGLPDKPVGTIWMAFASKDAVLAKKFQMTKHRDLNIQMSANLALSELRRFILTNEGEI